MPKDEYQKLRILLFETSAANAERVAEALDYSDLDYDLTTAASLSEGLEILGGTLFDILLINPKLPDSSPSETFSKLAVYASDLAIVVLTEKTDEPAAIQAIEMGAQDCFELGQLKEVPLRQKLRYAVERTKLRHKLRAHGQEVQNSEDLLQSIFNTSQDAALLLGQDHEIKRLNAHAAALLEDQADRLVGETFPFAVNVGEPTELEIPEADGSIRTIQLSAVDYAWEGEAAILVLLREISEPRRADGALEMEKQKFSAALGLIADAIILTNGSGLIKEINRAASELLAVSAKDSIGLPLKKILRLKHPDTGEDIKDLWQALMHQKFKETSAPLGLPMERSDGQTLNVSVETICTYDDDKERQDCITVLRQISSETMVEDELLKAEKLNSISLLAGGIAHDFNNMLASILGNISMVQIELDQNHKHSARLEAAEKAALQAKSLTQQLLTFAKGGAPILELTSISEIVEESSKFALRGSNVDCTIEKDEDLWKVNADRGQISQVINNLMINADQAMPKGGTITLRMRNLDIDDNEIAFVQRGQYACIEVSDNGIGISEKDLTEIFNPYFTTKASGNGLGLASCQSIIKSHGGAITARSCLGVGSTFTVFLPRSEETPAATNEPEPKETNQGLKNAIHRGNGRVLVMDDMEAMMLVAGEILTVLGYEVEYSTNGDEAIEAYKRAKEAGNPFQAVVFDLTVPGGMGGEEAANILIEYDPDLIAIASSGYSTSNIMSDYKDSAFSAVVPKPYRIKEMSDALNRVLSV